MASLLITHGVLEGQYILLPDDPIVSVGRDDQCTIQLLDPSISRKHLQIRWDRAKKTRVAADYRSAHGVIVNDERIVSPVPIKDGDQITLGQTTLVYLDKDHPDAASATKDVQGRREWKRSTLIRLPGTDPE